MQATVSWLVLGIGIGLLVGSNWQSPAIRTVLGFVGLAMLVVGFLAVRRTRPVAAGLGDAA